MEPGKKIQKILNEKDILTNELQGLKLYGEFSTKANIKSGELLIHFTDKNDPQQKRKNTDPMWVSPELLKSLEEVMVERIVAVEERMEAIDEEVNTLLNRPQLKEVETNTA